MHLGSFLCTFHSFVRPGSNQVSGSSSYGLLPKSFVNRRVELMPVIPVLLSVRLCRQSVIYRPRKLDRGQVAALQMGIQRRCNDLLSVADQMKGVRADTRHALEGGNLKFFEKRRRIQQEASEFNQLKQARV